MSILVFRSDSSVETGTGHIMRCIALAQACQDEGGEVVFVCSQLHQELELRLIEENIRTHYIQSAVGSRDDAYETTAYAKTAGARWIVVDGYHFGAKYQKMVKDAGFSLLFIDDYGHARHYYADIVLNQNAGADIRYYKNREPYTRVLLGPAYSLLRREFQKPGGNTRIIPEIAHKILITFGGSDPENITLKVINAIRHLHLPDTEIIAVIGGINPNYDLIRKTTQELPGFSIKKNIDNMPELMELADLAISAGGSTTWELAYSGVPAILCPIAKNQAPAVRYLEKEGIVRCVPKKKISDMEHTSKIISKLIQSPNEREQLSRKMRALVDGRGPLRVLMQMDEDVCHMRKAKRSDWKKLWDWANDPVVRKSSFNTDPIPLNTHKAWFDDKLKDPNSHIYILYTKRELIGQIRFDIMNGKAEVDITIDKEFRGCGLGTFLLVKGIRKFVKNTKIAAIQSRIKKQNLPSVKMFKRANFQEHGIKKVNGVEAVHMIWSIHNPVKTGRKIWCCKCKG